MVDANDVSVEIQRCKDEVCINQQFHKPNPLFELWLTEWRDDRRKKGFLSACSFSRALWSLKQCPLRLERGKDCANLKGFGKKICEMLDYKLAQYRKEHPSDEDVAPMVPSSVIPPSPRVRKRPATKAVRNDVVVITSTPNESASTANFVVATTSDTAVPSTSSSPPKQPQPKKKVKTNKKNNANGEESPPPVHICIPAGDAEVKLLVDSGETRNRNTAQRATLQELESQAIPFKIGKLNVGDFLWVVSSGENDLVLPFIVERKRLDDLADSIKSQRYHEQKWRLRATGFTVIYLIESVEVTPVLPAYILYQAETNTEVNDKFCVHRTNGITETISYLATMTRVMQRKFQNKTLVGCTGVQEPEYSLRQPILYLYTLKEFNNGSAKLQNFTVREMFAQHLLQISGASAEAVSAIIDKFPTPALLRQAFSSCSSETECVSQLTSLRYGTLHRKVSSEVARTIYLLYTSHDFSTI